MTDDAPASAYESLLAFLYRSPAALLETACDGRIRVITPAAARCLMPIAPGARLDNVFDVLGDALPGLREQVEAFVPRTGRITDGETFHVPDPAGDRVLSLALFMTMTEGADGSTGIAADGRRLVFLIDDVTTTTRRADAVRLQLEGALQLATEAEGMGLLKMATPTGGLTWTARTFALHGRPDWPPDDAAGALAASVAEPVRDVVHAWLRDQFDRPAALPLEYEIAWPDGSRHWLCTQAQRVPEGGADGFALMGVVWDATPAHALRQAVEARRVAEQASLAQAQFLSRMSHEFRTPLNAILGFSEMLLSGDDEPLTVAQRARLGHVRDAGHLMLHLVEDLLDYARIERQGVSPHFEAVDLQPLVAQACGELARDAARAQVKVEPPRPAPEVAGATVRADRHRLHQVLLNLVSNAIKYNRPGGHVDVRIEAQGDAWRLCVQDDGLGMSDEQRRRLFRPFERLGREGTGIPGTGLGLVIVRDLVTAMQGTLDLSSAPGAGSEFRVTLPAAAPPGDARGG